MNLNICIFLTISITVITLQSCGNKKLRNNHNETVVNYQKISPDFNADSSYLYVEKQVSFGPRTPNSRAHEACANFLEKKLKQFGATLSIQKANVKSFDGKSLKMTNVIGSYNIDKAERILLFAHWDSRPFADQDPNLVNRHKPILGANDGASGIGILLEIARVLQSKLPQIGVDIVFLDIEDYGVPDFANIKDPDETTWCLGSQYFSQHLFKQGYNAKYGILLDMVGATNATFYKEYFSERYADNIIDKVWSTARQLNYESYFVDQMGGGITDDHLPINNNLHIPSIDIIQFDKNSQSGFGNYWHTLSDNMNTINRKTLKAVGQTLLEVIYKEK